MLRIYNFLFGFLLFLCIGFPMVLELLYIKFTIFLILFFLNPILFKSPFHLKIIQPHIIVFFLFFLAFIIGIINSTPGKIKLGLLYLIWPSIYYIVFLRGLNRSRLEITLNVLSWSSLYIGIVGLWNILESYYDLDMQIKFFDSEIIGLGLYDGYIEFTMFSLNSLPFLIPFNLLCFYFNIYSKKRLTFIINSIILILLAFLSLRKALWVVIILTLAFITIKHFYSKVSFITKVFSMFFILITLTLIITFDFGSDTAIGQFKDGINFGKNIDAGNELRLEQVNALTKGILQNPLFGAGLGASAEIYGSIRNIDEPWSYEVFFLALVYQIGIVLFLILSLITFYIFGKLLLMNTSLSITLFISFIMMILVGFTNPVFMRFDGLWFFYIPLFLLIFKKNDYELR